MPARKNRVPSKCREWERDRRNRFNEACNQLAVLVVENPIENNTTGNNIPTLAKVEVIQRAIELIKHLLVIKKKLDTQLVSIQAEVNGYKNVKINRSDVSIQVNRQTKTIVKGTRPKKIIWREALRKDKHIITIQKDIGITESVKTASNPKLPKLLPKSMSTTKIASDKGVVILPTAPYILPNRPVVLPTVQPTFLLLESFIPTSRNNMPIVPRLVSEITKTTMVNNIPIAAFSFPLSASKNKKHKTNERSSTDKIPNICQKKHLKIIKNSKKLSEKPKSVTKTVSPKLQNKVEKLEMRAEKVEKGEVNVSENDKEQLTTTSPELSNKDIEPIKTSLNSKSDSGENNSLQNIEIAGNTSNNKECGTNVREEASDLPKLVPPRDNKSTNEHQEPEDEHNNKQDKLESILDTSMCESTVDGGNARLELAEELLAASPTAAFLMSFPLVSGVRVDSPAEEEHHNVSPEGARPLSQNKRDIASVHSNQIESFFNKPSESEKPSNMNILSASSFNVKQKNNEKQVMSKENFGNQSITIPPHSSSESFLNLPSNVLGCTSIANDNLFSLDFEVNFSKNCTSTHSYHSNNLILKNDPLYTKNNNFSMYSSSNLAVGHEYNNFGLYPCAMEKYSNNVNDKNKTDYSAADDINYSKVSSGRPQYDLDLGLSQKSYEISNTINNNFPKENVFPVATTFQNTSSYNPFNADLHIPLSIGSNNVPGRKSNFKSANPFYTDTFTNLYSQPSTLWPEDFNLYSNNTANVLKNSKTDQTPEQVISSNQKYSNNNTFDNKTANYSNPITKLSKHEVNQLVSDKTTKKSPNKAHINWMTSEARSTQSNAITGLHQENKEAPRPHLSTIPHSTILPNLDYNITKKQDFGENNLFPLAPTNNINQDDIQLWPTARSIVSTEITLEPPPISLPTLVGDLALGPHERRKSVERGNRGNVLQSEYPACNSFLSVTQLMNRSVDVPTGRGQSVLGNNHKKNYGKNDNIFNYSGTITDKPIGAHSDSNNVQPSYFFNDLKQGYVQYNSGQPKHKNHNTTERVKCHKNNYSTEALLKGGNNINKVGDNSIPVKLTNTSQKYLGFSHNQESQLAQVSHFPCITDYPENSYPPTGLYNSSVNSAPTSLYSNLMAGGGGSSIVSSYSSTTFTPEFADYASMPTVDCNYSYPMFDNLKSRSQIDTFNHTKISLDLPKAKETLGKHKSEYTKKDQGKKLPNKKSKMNTGVDDWTEANDTTHHSRHTKRIAYAPPEEMPFSNYLMNQSSSHSQHPTMPEMLGYASSATAALPMAAVSARTPLNFPTNASRTNFNLSTLFPEIAKVRQS